MIKRPIVFSLLHEQSIFMTAIMSLLTFLAVLALGVALSMGTGVARWNTQWELYATVQTTDNNAVAATQKVIDANTDKIHTARKISTDEMRSMMRPWISGGGALENYMPQMWEIRFKNRQFLDSFGAQIPKNVRFLTHADALHPATNAGWKMIMIAGLVLVMTLAAIGACISYIARNTAMLHRRELEILNQIGASDSFVAHQMQIIVGKICISAAAAGFVGGALVLLLILGTAAGARTGLMAMMGLNYAGWIALISMPIIIVIFAIWITRRTTLNILKNS